MELGLGALSPRARASGGLGAALGSMALGVVVSFLGCASSRVSRLASAQDLDSADWVVVQLLDAEIDETLDAATLAELDELLLHPLDLNGSGLDRLLALPWLGRAQVQAVAAGRPLESVDDLVRLPGWSQELVLQTAPFVRIEPGTTSARRKGTTAALESKRQTWRARVSSSSLQFGGRVPAAPGDRESGFLRLTGGSLAVWGGDLRLAHAQGLLLWTGVSAVRGTTPVVRRSRGLGGFEGATRTHVLRGGGVRVERGGFGLTLATGEHDTGPAELVSMQARPVQSAEFQIGVARVGTIESASLGVQIENPTGRAAFEIAGRPEAHGVAFAGELEQDDFAIGARLQSTPTGFPAPLGTLSPTDRRAATRGALLRVRLGGRALRLTGSTAQTSRRETDGDETARTERTVQLRWRKDATRLRLRLGQRHTRENIVLDEGGTRTPGESGRSLDCGLRHHLEGGWIVGLELRYREEARENESPGSGRAWQVRFERHSKWVHMTTGLTSFQAGSPGPLVAEPGIGGGLGTRWLRGDGLRLASVLRFRGPGYDIRLVLGFQSTAEVPSSYDLETSLGLRYP